MTAACGSGAVGAGRRRCKLRELPAAAGPSDMLRRPHRAKLPEHLGEQFYVENMGVPVAISVWVREQERHPTATPYLFRQSIVVCGCQPRAAKPPGVRRWEIVRRSTSGASSARAAALDTLSTVLCLAVRVDANCPAAHVNPTTGENQTSANKTVAGQRRAGLLGSVPPQGALRRRAESPLPTSDRWR